MSENNNPNTPSEEVSGEESSDDIFSLDDLDDILGEEDSNEANDSGGDTSTTSRPGESLNSESPGESSSSEEKSSSDGSAISKKEIILSKIKLKLAPLLSKWKLLIEYFQKLKTIILKPVEKVSLGLKRFAEKTKLHIVFKFLIQGFSKLKHIFPNAGGIIKRSIAKPLHTIPQLKNKVARLVKSLTRVQVIMLLVGLILFSGIIFLVRESLRSRWIPRIDEPFVTNLLDYGKNISSFAVEGRSLVSFYDSFPQERFVILLDKTVVNLKRKSPSDLPLASVEFYVSVDSRDTAIEIKDRMHEIKDRVERILEEFSLPEISSERGKLRARSKIKFELNQLLNQGHVNDVYFKTLMVNANK